MEATAKTNQPQAATEMKVMTVSETNQSSPQTHCEHSHHKKATRLRGGGAGKDFFMGCIACFVCFKCCEGCCDCIGDIICCPCEICC